MSGSLGISQSSSRPKDVAAREFKQQRGFVADTLRGRVETGGPQIQGPFVAPIGAAEQRGLRSLEGNVFGATGLGAAQDQALQQALSTNETNPFLQATIDAAVRPIIENAQLRELQDRALFTGAGQKIQGSSAFTEDRTRSLRDTERAVGDVASQIAFQDHQLRGQQRLEAANISNARFAEQRETISALALPRLIEQFGIDKGNEELQRRFQVIQDALTQLGQLSAPVIAQDSHGAAFNTSGGFSGGGTGAK